MTTGQLLSLTSNASNTVLLPCEKISHLCVLFNEFILLLHTHAAEAVLQISAFVSCDWSSGFFLWIFFCVNQILFVVLFFVNFLSCQRRGVIDKAG